jgi:photosystem II stability/assembly factor-like uncharacterized protein
MVRVFVSATGRLGSRLANLIVCVGLMGLSASLSGATAAATRSLSASEIEVVRLESAQLGLVGTGGPFTSTSAARPARLLISDSFGAKFTDISPPAPDATRVDDVSFLDRAHGWVVIWNLDTTGVTVYRTRDGGRSWHAAPAGGHSANAGAVATVQFLSRRLGWLVVEEPTAPFATLFRSSDGGASWHAVRRLPEIAPVAFETPTRAWQAGGGDSLGLFRSETGGRSWRRVELPRPPAEHGSRAFYGLPAFVGGGQVLAPITFVRGRSADLVVYRSIDDGRHWRLATLLRLGTTVARFCVGEQAFVSFVNQRVWWTAAYRSGRPVAYRTADAGHLWTATPIATPPTGQRCPLPFAQAASGRAAWVFLHTSRGTKLYATSDAGNSWRSLVTATR